ncbi:DUF3606 domain-containing protein [Luteimonas sp. MHLX1A]|uniref:DUF3606 domain-containing protein n=1 Tax=Alterluteimonas muca TaxID=2878684 RepID=UPI001E542E05|nr:DUF3606 domain-containing protein [Luteimonas sp. MHLX1A]MCD9046881.1 DUF3606 domain-containing protein [Luteimonas sp. MHLX1A]
MADNTDDRGPQDRARVAMGQDHEVRYWSEKFGVSKEKLQEAVDAVGNSAAAVEEYLSGR